MQAFYEAELQAYKAVWGLIIYFSENDNDRNILVRGEKGEDGNKVMYFRPQQAMMFCDKLNEVFYDQGHGVFLPKEIKELIFEFRSQIYAWYHIAKKDNLEKMKINNKEKYNRIVEIRALLTKELRNRIKVV